MLIQKTFSAILILAILVGTTAAQQTKTPETKHPDISPQVRQNAVEYLRETISDVSRFKNQVNRNYFNIELAALLWKYDEKTAKAMLSDAAKEISGSWAPIVQKAKDLKIELPKLDERYNSMLLPDRPPTAEEIELQNKTGGLQRNSILLWNRLTALDPVFAYDVYKSTGGGIPPLMLNYRVSVEEGIVRTLILRDKTEKALEIAREMLKREVSGTFLRILGDIYDMDHAAGHVLAEEAFAQIVASGGSAYSSYRLRGFFSLALPSALFKNNPMLSEKSLASLASLLGKSIISKKDVTDRLALAETARMIQKFAPAESMQIKKSIATRYNPPVDANRLVTDDERDFGYKASANVANRAADAANRAANAAMNASNRPAGASRSRSKRKNPKTEKPPEKSVWELKEEAKEAVSKRLREGKFTADERVKVVEEVKKVVFVETRGYYLPPNGYSRIVIEFAEFAAISADKEVAEKLLEEASVWIMPQTKTYEDYISKAVLAIGNAKFHPERSFTILESLKGINGVIENTVGLGDFMDISRQYVVSDEITLSLFLPDLGLEREFARGNGEIPHFIYYLAASDFPRTKSLINKIERQDVRMAVRLLMLRVLLSDGDHNRDNGI